MRLNSLYKRSIISAKDLSREDLDLIFETAAQFKTDGVKPTLTNKIIAHCFFESSTRTRLSFETSTLRLGGKVIGFAGKEGTAVQKGETLHDTMRMVSAYADLIVVRHPKEGAASLTKEIAACPVINAGDGANQHPTQAILDLFTIKECQSKLDGLSIALVGDLKYGRTIHSLTQLLALYDVRLYLVSPESLALPESACNEMKQRGLRFSFHQRLEDIISDVDILYSTRIQKERFGGGDPALTEEDYIVTSQLLKKAKPNLKILHPLPRINEIAKDVDDTPHAHYFEQAANAVPVRQALLNLILNEATS